MNIKTLMDSAYLLPVLLEHLEKPSELTAKILAENDIDKDKVEEFSKVKWLLTYHMQTVQNWRPNYTLLRTGLKQYFDVYMSNIFRKLSFVNKDWKVLDYGCGSGQLGLQFFEDNPDSRVIFLDRVNENNLPNFICADFEKVPEWYKGCLESFDCVLLSEVLHCKDFEGQKYLIGSSFSVLKKGGYLMVVENEDYCMAYRMNRLKGTNTLNVVDFDSLTELVRFFNLQLKVRTSIFNHQIYIYEKF